MIFLGPNVQLLVDRMAKRVHQINGVKNVLEETAVTLIGI